MKALCGLASPPQSTAPPSFPLSNKPSLPDPPTCPPCGPDVHGGAWSIQSRSSRTIFFFTPPAPSTTCSISCLSQPSEEILYNRDHSGARPFTARQHSGGTSTSAHTFLLKRREKKTNYCKQVRQTCRKTYNEPLTLKTPSMAFVGNVQSYSYPIAHTVILILRKLIKIRLT